MSRWRISGWCLYHFNETIRHIDRQLAMLGNWWQQHHRCNMLLLLFLELLANLIAGWCQTQVIGYCGATGAAATDHVAAVSAAAAVASVAGVHGAVAAVQ